MPGLQKNQILNIILLLKTTAKAQQAKDIYRGYFTSEST